MNENASIDGLYYYGKRHYSPAMRRWLTRDPIGEEGGANLYGFCGNNANGEFDVLGERNSINDPEWKLLGAAITREFHTYNCMEFGGKGTKDKYIEHFKNQAFQGLPSRYRAVFSYNLVNALGMNDGRGVCWCLVLDPFDIYFRDRNGNREYQLRTTVKLLDKHPTCCPKPEIQITGMTGRRIVLEL